MAQGIIPSTQTGILSPGMRQLLGSNGGRDWQQILSKLGQMSSTFGVQPFGQGAQQRVGLPNQWAQQDYYSSQQGRQAGQDEMARKKYEIELAKHETEQKRLQDEANAVNRAYPLDGSVQTAPSSTFSGTNQFAAPQQYDTHTSTGQQPQLNTIQPSVTTPVSPSAVPPDVPEQQFPDNPEVARLEAVLQEEIKAPLFNRTTSGMNAKKKRIRDMSKAIQDEKYRVRFGRVNTNPYSGEPEALNLLSGKVEGVGGDNIDYYPKGYKHPDVVSQDTQAGVVKSKQAITQAKDTPLTASALMNYQDAQGNRPPPGSTMNDITANKYKIVSTTKQTQDMASKAAYATLDTLNDLIQGIYPKDESELGVISRLVQDFSFSWQRLNQSNKDLVFFEAFKQGTIAPLIRAIGEKGNLATEDVERALELIPSTGEGWFDLPDKRSIALGKMKQLRGWFDKAMDNVHEAVAAPAGIDPEDWKYLTAEEQEAYKGG